MTYNLEYPYTKPLGDALYNRCDHFLNEQIPDTFFRFHKCKARDRKDALLEFLYEVEIGVKEFAT